MTARRVFLSTSEAATEELAERLGAHLQGGALVALDGEMGAGKTTFVRGLARGLGSIDPVASPSFALAHVYGAGPTGTELHHLDAWQIRRSSAFLADGGFESIVTALDERHVVAVEWAERVRDRLPRPHLAVRLAPTARGGRRIEFEVVPGAPAARERRLVDALRALEPPPGAPEEPR